MRIVFGILVALLSTEINLIAAEAGMPQLNPEYWASQAFWLVLIFTFLYLLISKLFIPKIKDSLDDRDNKIKQDLDEASRIKVTAEEKEKEYLKTMEDAKKDILKTVLERKSKLNLDIQNKKKVFEKEIDSEIEKVQKEIHDLKKTSVSDINKISEQITLNIIEKISGDKLNESSIKAAVTEVAKVKIHKYL
jgi:F-type H+-transporting ATPase subunit b|tara:strand:+ start:594 stop:1169 length:576 start_codon:yes stop_codon:yes gene_type:complete